MIHWYTVGDCYKTIIAQISCLLDLWTRLISKILKESVYVEDCCNKSKKSNNFEAKKGHFLFLVTNNKYCHDLLQDGETGKDRLEI